MSAVIHAREPSAKYIVREQPALVHGFELVSTFPSGVAKLRELVLSLAVRGLLTARMENEEPMDQLAPRRAPTTPDAATGFRGHQKSNQSSIDPVKQWFVVPNGWRWVRLGDVCSYIQRGKGPEYSESPDFPVVSQKCVRWSGLDLSQARFITSDSLLKYDEARFLREGDLLWNSTGTGTIGRAVIVPLQSKHFKLVADSHVTVVRVSGIDPRFVLRWIQSPDVQARIADSASGTTNQIELATSTVAAHPIPLPPLAEQRCIVARVEELMKLCDALEQSGRLADEQHARLTSTLFDALAASESAHALAENWQRIAEHFELLLDRPEAIDALEQIILQLAVRGLLVSQILSDEPASELILRIRSDRTLKAGSGVPKAEKSWPSASDEDQPFELPVGWAWARFGQLGEFGRGKSKHRPRNDPKLFVQGVHPLIQTGEVSRAEQFITEVHSYYSDVGLAQSKLWPKGTLCITIAANIADSAILSFDACFPDSVVGFVPAKIIGDARYFLTFMKTVRQRLIDFAPATAQKNINLDVLNNVLIPLPPLAEQHRIVARVEELRRLCVQLRERLALARYTQNQLVDALVAQAVV